MSNKKYNLLPYETIVKAAAGEPEAVNTVIQTYTGYIKYLSTFKGVSTTIFKITSKRP